MAPCSRTTRARPGGRPVLPGRVALRHAWANEMSPKQPSALRRVHPRYERRFHGALTAHTSVAVNRVTGVSLLARRSRAMLSGAPLAAAGHCAAPGARRCRRPGDPPPRLSTRHAARHTPRNRPGRRLTSTPERVQRQSAGGRPGRGRRASSREQLKQGSHPVRWRRSWSSPPRFQCVVTAGVAPEDK